MLPLFPETSLQALRNGHERRAWPRCLSRVRVLFLPDDCVLDEPYAGWMINCSAGGVRLAVCREVIETGTLLHIRSLSAPAGTSWLSVRVRNRRRTETGWELGCEIVRLPLANRGQETSHLR